MNRIIQYCGQLVIPFLCILKQNLNIFGGVTRKLFTDLISAGSGRFLIYRSGEEVERSSEILFEGFI